MILLSVAPGVGLAGAVAVASGFAEAVLAVRGVAVPAIVIALALGIMLHAPAGAARFQPGLSFSVKTLLRLAIALLGLRIALSDIADLGLGVVLVTVAVMLCTVVSGPVLARLLGLAPDYGALAGATCGVCGASAAMATSTVLPDYPERSTDLVFVVVAANTVATAQMVIYPSLCKIMGISDHWAGVLLGLSIHDIAQVAGAGYALSIAAGNSAVIAKLLRVFLLLPVVVGVGHWIRGQNSGRAGRAAVPTPWFALAFLCLAGVNSVVPQTGLAEGYAPLRVALLAVSKWGLLVAIAALGLGTSVRGLMAAGWRRGAVFLGATIVNLVVAASGVALLSR